MRNPSAARPRLLRLRPAAAIARHAIGCSKIRCLAASSDGSTMNTTPNTDAAYKRSLLPGPDTNEEKPEGPNLLCRRSQAMAAKNAAIQRECGFHTGHQLRRHGQP